MSKEEKARIRREYRLLAAQIHETEEGRAGLSGLSQLITKNNELYSSVGFVIINRCVVDPNTLNLDPVRIQGYRYTVLSIMKEKKSKITVFFKKIYFLITTGLRTKFHLKKFLLS